MIRRLSHENRVLVANCKVIFFLLRFGHTVSSYCLVFDGCRHYWLTCQPLTADPMERHLLQQPLCELLDLCVPLLGGRHGVKNEVRRCFVLGPVILFMGSNTNTNSTLINPRHVGGHGL